MKLHPCAFVIGLAVGLVVAGPLAAKDTPATNKTKIVGSWQLTKAATDLPPESVVTFAKDGKLMIAATADGKKLTISGTYTVVGDKLTISLKGPDGKEHKETMTITKLTAKVLHTKDNKGKVDEFKKK